MNYTLKNDFYEITVSTLGAEMLCIKSASGKELLWQNNLGEGWSNHAPCSSPSAADSRTESTYTRERPFL
jgi:hypothetical protein